jgi:hypothetical protein
LIECAPALILFLSFGNESNIERQSALSRGAEDGGLDSPPRFQLLYFFLEKQVN